MASFRRGSSLSLTGYEPNVIERNFPEFRLFFSLTPYASVPLNMLYGLVRLVWYFRFSALLFFRNDVLYYGRRLFRR